MLIVPLTFLYSLFVLIMHYTWCFTPAFTELYLTEHFEF